MADNNRKYRRDHAIEGLVPEKTKMEKANQKGEKIVKKNDD